MYWDRIPFVTTVLVLYKPTLPTSIHQITCSTRYGNTPSSFPHGILLCCFQNGCYGNLFVGALRRYGILCLGLYRQLDPRPSVGSYNRFIVTNPPPEYNLYPSDKVSLTLNVSYISLALDNHLIVHTALCGVASLPSSYITRGNCTVRKNVWDVDPRLYLTCSHGYCYQIYWHLVS